MCRVGPPDRSTDTAGVVSAGVAVDSIDCRLQLQQGAGGGELAEGAQVQVTRVTAPGKNLKICYKYLVGPEFHGGCCCRVLGKLTVRQTVAGGI